MRKKNNPRKGEGVAEMLEEIICTSSGNTWVKIITNCIKLYKRLIPTGEKY